MLDRLVAVVGGVNPALPCCRQELGQNVAFFLDGFGCRIIRQRIKFNASVPQPKIDPLVTQHFHRRCIGQPARNHINLPREQRRHIGPDCDDGHILFRNIVLGQ